MRTTLLRAALAGVLIVGVANAACARDGRNAALLGGAALGAIGGVALGAALASPPPPPYYAPRPVYVEEPAYAPPPPRGPVCHYEQRKQWYNDVEFTYRRVQVCE